MYGFHQSVKLRSRTRADSYDVSLSTCAPTTAQRPGDFLDRLVEIAAAGVALTDGYRAQFGRVGVDEQMFVLRAERKHHDIGFTWNVRRRPFFEHRCEFAVHSRHGTPLSQVDRAR
jgi:hypothetical protein